MCVGVVIFEIRLHSVARADMEFIIYRLTSHSQCPTCLCSFLGLLAFVAVFKFCFLRQGLCSHSCSRTQFIDQPDLELEIVLPLSPKCRDQRRAPSQSARSSFFIGHRTQVFSLPKVTERERARQELLGFLKTYMELCALPFLPFLLSES